VTEVLAAAVVLVVVAAMAAGALYDFFQRQCPHCGESKTNRWRREYPACRKCGRDRTKATAGSGL